MKEVALITGASSGIGRELANEHAKRKRDLIIVARNLEELEKVKEELESQYSITVRCIPKDLSQIGAAREIFEELKSENISISYLMNNAGFGGQGKFYLRKLETDVQMIQVNIVALTELTRLFLPEMVFRKKGKIMNIASTAALMPGPLQAVYFASKSYVYSFSKSIASELEGTGVSVTAVLPGAIETKFAKTAGLEKAKLFAKTFSPKLVARDSYEAMEEGKLSILTGLSLGQKLQLKLLPILPKRMVANKIKRGQE